MIYWCVYLPYFAFAAIVIGGLKYNKPVVVVLGLFFCLVYNPKPELQILTKKRTFENCTFNVIKPSWEDDDDE